MRTKLGPDGLDGLLDSLNLAVLATYRKDGTALLSPIWFIYEDAGFTLGVDAGDIKLRHIERDPRVTIVVSERELPYRGFEIRGSARVTDATYAPEMRRIGRRYIGERADAFYPDGAEGSIIRIEPGATRGWDFRDEFPDAPIAGLPA